MKKSWNKTIYILAATCGLLFSSCNDFLDRQEDEKLTFDKIWESRNTIRQVLVDYYVIPTQRKY